MYERTKIMAGSEFEKKSGKMSYPIEDYTPPYRQSKHDLKSSYAWDGLLSRSDVLAAPVRAFRHVCIQEVFQGLHDFLRKFCEIINQENQFFTLFM